MTFRLFGDPACTVEVFRSTSPLDVLGSATSTDFTPTAPGTYRWTTDYSGDTNHEQASTPCDRNISVSITTSSPSTTAPPTMGTPTTTARPTRRRPRSP